MGILRSNIWIKDAFVCLANLSGSEHLTCPQARGLGGRISEP